MTLWTVDGDNLDVAYTNVRYGTTRIERRLREQLDAMWAVYAPYAESDFRDGFARDPDARFWEMYLGVQLLCEGRTLLTAAQRGVNGSMPDICVVERGRRIWIEAIVPERGEGADAVPLPSPINRGGRVRAAPIREIDLRTTGAFWTKSQVVGHYLNLGVIGAQDVRLIAIGAGRFGAYASEHPIPQVLSALFPIGGNVRGFEFSNFRLNAAPSNFAVPVPSVVLNGVLMAKGL